MATRPSVQQTVSKWQQNTAAAGPAYLQGVQNSADWAGNFVAAEPQMIAGIQAAIADGRITRHVQALGTVGWRAKVQAKGSTPWITGVQNATAAATAGYQTLYGYLDAADQAVSTLPRGTYQQNLQRMTTYVGVVHDQAVAHKAVT